MKSLWLDYQQAPPGWQWPGAALLAVSLIATAALFIHFTALQDEIERRADGIHKLQRRIDRAQTLSTSKNRGPAPNEILAQKLARYSAERWDGLFSDLEDAADETVTLLAITPDKQTVVLEGEAKTMADALSYAERLKTAEVLKNPQLSEFAVAKGHPQKPVRFVLTTLWAGAGNAP